MAPKTSQQAASGSAQEKKHVSVFKKLSNDIAKGKKKGTTIEASSTANNANETLRYCRKTGIALPASCIEDLAAVLDDDEDNCSKLDMIIFSTIVQALLQADYCLSGERLLYLLAASLSRDTNEANDGAEQAGVAARKDTIGKECLSLLLEFFLAEEKNIKIRRWAGVLCIQLVRECEKNAQRLELTGEELRRGIGQLILEESDEIIRFICGEVVKTLTEEGAPLDTLWPIGTDEDIYQLFPMPSQGLHSWTSNFERYVDYLFEKKKISKSSGQLLPVSSLELQPPHAIGAPHQNIVGFLDVDKLSILAPALAVAPDQILEIPTVMIEQVTITTQNLSQSILARVVFKVAKSGDTQCHLDGKVVDLEELSSSATIRSINTLKTAFRDYIPDTAIEEFDESEIPISFGDGMRASQHSKSQEIMQFKDSPVPTAKVAATGFENRTSSKSHQNSAITNINEASEVAVLENVQQISVQEDSTNEDVDNPDRPLDREKANEGTTSKARVRRTINKVKPRAKPPIIAGGRRTNVKESTSQVTSASKNDTQVKSGTQFNNTQTQAGKNSINIGSTQSQAEVKMKSNTVDKGASQQNKPLGPTASQQYIEKSKTSKGRGSGTESRSLVNSLKMKSQNVASDSEDITTPESYDTSTPRMMLPPPKPSNSKAQAISTKAASTSQPQDKKKYSLHGTKTTATEANQRGAKMFDVPGDDENQESGEEASSRMKRKSVSNAAAEKNTTKSKKKPGRKSAPAILQQSNTPVRHSQRAAASKANQSIQNMTDDENDEVEDEFVEVEEVSQSKTKSAAVQRTEPKAVQTQAKLKGSKNMIHSEPSPSKTLVKAPAISNPSFLAGKTPSSDDQIHASKQEFSEQPDRETDTSLVKMQTGMEDDLYGATPPKPRNQVLKNSPILTKQHDTTTVAPAPRKSEPSISDIELASQPDHLLENIEKNEVSKDPANIADKLSIKGKVANKGKGSVQVGEGLIMSHSESKVTKKMSFTTTDETKSEIWKLPSRAVPEFSSPNAPAVTSVLVGAENNDKYAGEMEEPEEEEDQENVTPEAIMISVDDPDTAVSDGVSESSDIQMLEYDAGEELAANHEYAKQAGQSNGKPDPDSDDQQKAASVNPLEKAEHNKKQCTSEVQEQNAVAAKLGASKSVSHSNSKQKTNNNNEDQKDKGHESSNATEHGSNKRKPDAPESRPVKRHKHERGTAVQSEMDIAPPFRNVEKERTQKHQKPEHVSPSPLRQGLRLKEAQKVAETLQEVTGVGQTVDEKVHRKTPIISFGAQGPHNQGRPTARKTITGDAYTSAVRPERQVADTDSGHKRKRSHGNEHQSASPPAKRRESSPVQGPDNDRAEDGAAPLKCAITPQNRVTDMRFARPQLISRASSHGSRVDANGSPIGPASIQVDRIGQLKQQLVEDNVIDDDEIFEDPPKVVEGEVKTRPRGLSKVFGPMLKVSARPKAQPSSPEEVTIRYVAHEKTEGQYTGLASREVIPFEKVLPNPFATEQVRKSSKFTDRLLASAVKKGRNSHDDMLKDYSRGHRITREQGDQYQLPKLPRDGSRVHFTKERNGYKSFDPEETLVDSKYRHVNHLPELSDMTNGTSFESSDSSREPLAERSNPNTLWNVALRPHYNSLSQAVHRVADEVIIRLSDEEDRMGLMVEQYRDNGGRIVENLSKKRDSERTIVLQDLDGKKQEMMSVYTEAKGSIQETAAELKALQLNRFEKDWSKQQAEVRKQISEGRKDSEEEKSDA